MTNFSNAVRCFKLAFSKYLEEWLFRGLAVPERKFAADAIWGLLKSGSPLVSEQARALCEAAKLITTEKRLCSNYASADLRKLEANLIAFSANELMDVPYQVDFDDSDIVKRYGREFECLDYIRDGSVEGRPPARGYKITGALGLCHGGFVAPLSLRPYSSLEKGHLSENDETQKAFLKIMGAIENKSLINVTMDRGYDASFFVDMCREYGVSFVIRAKSARVYKVGRSAVSATDWAAAQKGRFSFKFVNRKGEKINSKATSTKAGHKRLGEVWLVAEYMPREKEPRVYLTSIDAAKKEGVKKTLKAYRKRWPIEEMFRFAKCELGLERFEFRSLRAMRNFTIIVECCIALIGKIVSEDGALYRLCMDAWKGFGDDPKNPNPEKRYGKATLKLYRVKRGIQAILAHTAGHPDVKRRRRKEKPAQLRLF